MLIRRLMSKSASTKKVALVLNSGSSSIKFGVFELSLQKEVRATSLLKGQVERIGSVEARLEYTVAGERKSSAEPGVTDHGRALEVIEKLLNDKKVQVVGHRVVHGGTLSAPALINEQTLQTIEECTPLAPLHNPPALKGIRKARDVFKCAHVAVFDTAFHATMAPETYNYALPKHLKLRRYGFHGTSYLSVVSKLPSKYRNVIIAHLGNGASMCCVRDGKCVDTTMGLTPLEGLVMGTRCGDIDPGIVAYLQRELSYTPAQVDTLLNKQSGLLGLSGVSADMREIKEAARRGNPDAQLARAVYIERIRKYLGSYLVKLQQVDAVVFTAGVGEHDAELRAAVCANLDHLGIAIDPLLNQKTDDVFDVSAKFARTKVLVVKTNEEEAIALQAAEVAELFQQEVRLEKETLKKQLQTQMKPQPSGSLVPPFNSRGIYVDGVGPTAGEEVGLLYQVLPYGVRLGYSGPLRTRTIVN